MSTTKNTTWLATALAVALTSACAPDAMQNVRATGFNGYLDTVQQNCQPLWVGTMLLTRFDMSSAGGQESNYTALLDAASRLYYNRISPADFRSAVKGQASSGNDPRTDRSIDCMLAQLPSDRPSSPPGGLLK